MSDSIPSPRSYSHSSDDEHDQEEAADAPESKVVKEYRDEKLQTCPKPMFNALRPIKGGVLTKQGRKYKSWKQRLFVLQGKYMYYFLTTQDQCPRGVIYIENAKVVEEVEMGKDKKMHCFSVRSPRSWNLKNGKTFENRTYFFCTSSFQEMSDWISILNTMATTSVDL